MLSNHIKKALLFLPIIVLAFGLFFRYGSTRIDFANSNTAATQLTDLPQFELLRQTFERDSGYVRFITQLSPT